MTTATARTSRQLIAVLSTSLLLTTLSMTACDSDPSVEPARAHAMADNPGLVLPGATASHARLTCGPTGFSPEGQDLREISPGVVAYRAVTASQTATDRASVLSIEMYQAGGFTGATGPGTYALGEDYATCSNCVLIQSGCDQNGQCDATYLAASGRLIIADWTPGGAFRGYLEDVQLQQVTINPETFVATPVAGVDAWCLDYYAFDTLDGLSTGGHAHPGCVAQGTGTLIGDNIADLALPNCHGDMVHLHDGCGTARAIWLMGTTTECADCDVAIRALSDTPNGMVDTASVHQRHPGLTLAVVLGADGAGQAPDQAACYAYADRIGVDPAMVFIDHPAEATQIPLIAPAGYAFETQAHATLWSALNPYLSAENGVIANPYPWMAVLDGRNMEYRWSTTVGPGTLQGTLDALLQ